uniref:Uncharacterized protein n=1 Tax=Molossus molossus TaxID=27622 RepID=A0A7J8HHB0_MOLMO|nr:hypothetical protein HJG59_011039 [Molossus molossus]
MSKTSFTSKIIWFSSEALSRDFCSVVGDSNFWTECISSLDLVFLLLVVVNPHPKIFFDLVFYFLDRMEGKEGERERNIHVRVTLIACLLRDLERGWGSHLKPRYVLLIGNQTHKRSVLRLMLHLLSQTGQG